MIIQKFKLKEKNENMHLLWVKKQVLLAFELVCKKTKYIRGTNCATAGLKEVVHSPFEKVKTVFKIIYI